MNPNPIFPPHLQELALKMKGFPQGLADRHFTLMDRDYFLEFGEEEIRRHLNLLSTIDSTKHCCVFLHQGENGRLVLEVAGKDAPGILAVITGVLTSLGFDFESGRLFTWRTPDAPPPERLLFLDHFTGTLAFPEQAENFTSSQIESSMQSLFELVLKRKLREVQKNLHHRIGMYLGSVGKKEPPRKLYPLDISAETSADYTILHITGQSSPAFLFSLSNALAMKEMVLHKLYINTHGQKVDDTIYLTDKAGLPVSDPAQLNRLKTALALIKQFTLLLPLAPNHDLAIRQFDLFIDRIMDDRITESMVLGSGQNDIIVSMVKAFGTGEYLWEEFIRMQADTLLPFLRQMNALKRSKSKDVMMSELDNLLTDLPGTEEKIAALNTFKDSERFRIDLFHLTYPNRTFIQFSEELTDLADVVINTAVHILRGSLTEKHGSPEFNNRRCRFSVQALGKFGGRELGYASDLEIVLIFEADGHTNGKESPITNAEFFCLLVRELNSSLKVKNNSFFQLDLRLRPHGESGPLAILLESWQAYYASTGQAHDFERQSLIKIRPVYGDREFNTMVLAARDGLIYGEHPVGIDKVLTLREKQKGELTSRGNINAKFSPGGLCEIEYGVQFLQLRHGRNFPQLRIPGTLAALEHLLEMGVITPSEFEQLYFCYAFWRKLINALRMSRGQAKDLKIPFPDSEEFSFLSRRMGYLSRPGGTPEEQLHADIRRVRDAVSNFFKTRFIDFLETDFAEPGLPEVLSQEGHPSEVINRVMLELGVRYPHSAYQTLRRILAGTRRKSDFLSVLVRAAQQLRTSPSPDRVITNLGRFLLETGIADAILPQMLYYPKYMELITLIFGYGDYLSNILLKHPSLIHFIAIHSDLNSEKPLSQYRQEINQFAGTAEGGFEERRKRLNVYYQREILRTGIRDLYLKAPFNQITSELSSLAQACIGAITEMLTPETGRPGMPDMCIIALGKLGGQELNYSSDVDLVFVAEDELSPARMKELEQQSRLLIKAMSDPLSGGRMFRVDTKLRPYGNQGPLIGNRSFYENYYRTSADGWELQAWLKARPVAGNLDLCASVISLVRTVLLAPEKIAVILSSLQAVRRKALREFSPGSLDRDLKRSAGGIRTIEFFIQSLQVKWGAAYPETVTGHTLQAIGLLNRLTLLDTASADTLRDAYIFLRRTEHAVQLEGMQQRHLLPEAPGEFRRLALRLGYEDRLEAPAENQLREEYLRHTAKVLPFSERLLGGDLDVLPSSR